MDLKEVRARIGRELEGVDQRLTVLKECEGHIAALEAIVGVPAESPSQSLPRVPKTDPANPGQGSKTRHTNGEDAECIRCLKCGSSLEELIPHGPDGEPNLGSRRLGKVEDGERHLECPQCLAKNVFVRTVSPVGSRLLITQLKN